MAKYAKNYTVEIKLPGTAVWECLTCYESRVLASDRVLLLRCYVQDGSEFRLVKSETGEPVAIV